MIEMPSTGQAGVTTQARTDAGPRVALLTPAGVGAIAVIRMEGHGAERILASVFRHRSRYGKRLETDCIHYGEFRLGQELIDQVLVLPTVPVPEDRVASLEEERSFDICAHGGLRVVERIVMALTQAGATFIPREEIADRCWPASNIITREVYEALARARTARGVRFLLRQRNALPAELRRIARTAAHDPPAAMGALQTLLDASRGCRRLVEGATVVISGPPNSGKSTLANRLVGAKCSIVSAQAGTTRDWVSQETAVAGVPVTLIDTPGHEHSGQGVGRGHSGGNLDDLAAARARERGATADLHLRVFDGSGPPPDAHQPWSPVGIPTLLLLNKSDLGSAWTSADIEAQYCQVVLSISATEGANMDRLVREMGHMLGVKWADEKIIGLFTARQVRLVEDLIGGQRQPDFTGTALAELIGENF